MTIWIRLLYKPQRERLFQIHKTLGASYDERVLPSVGNEVMKSVIAQFDAEQSWRGEQEAAGRRLFATAHGRDGLDAGGGAGLLGLPPGYSIIGPPVPLEERRADMKARSQALLDKLGTHQF